MKFHVAGIQFRSRLEDTEYNLSQIATWCKRAASEGVEVVVFPEVCLTGYCRPKRMAELARPFAGALRNRVANIARENNMLIAFGMPEREGDRVYNTMIAVGPDGRMLARYRKTHLWAAESRWATPGTEFVTFQTDLARFGLMLCYDARFPEVTRSLALQNVEVVLVGSAWRSSHVEEWRLCIRARAIDNGIFVAGSDTLLETEYFQCAGGSLIVGPDGRELALAEFGKEGMIKAEIDTEVLAARQRDLPLLQERRPELYGGLAQKD